MVNCLVSFPAEFVALTVNVDVPSSVGIPEITPVVLAKSMPSGNEPPAKLHVMGASPLAASVWLYTASTAPSANDVVVIVGATPPSPSLQAPKENPTTAVKPTTEKIRIF
jgi:hypothetical protein